MASNYRDIVSNSSDSMSDPTELEVIHSIDLLTNRSSGTLISASHNKEPSCKKELFHTQHVVKVAEGSKAPKPLTKYSSSNNLTLIDSLSESTGRLETVPLNKFLSRSSENVSAEKSSRSSFPNPSKEGRAKVVLICEASSHPFQTRTIWLSPNTDCKVGRLISKQKVNVSNAIFDCKVLSRNHALLSYCANEKFYLKDLKSSNGTFINDKKLGLDAAELHFGDIVRFGVDVVEHTKNELHGCIKACVELYFPNGSPAAPGSADKAQNLKYSGESSISFEDLHQLSVYMQEATQRKQTYEFELQNAQNLLDAARQNTSDSWQTLLNKDEALQRIQLLERKIKILEKNMSEQALKNEITKLKEEKIAYQLSAKEVLQNVRLESSEALQKLSKMESTLAASKSNYKVLGKQIVHTGAILKDANERLRLLEIEYNDFRVKSEEVKRKTQLKYDQHLQQLSEKVQKQSEQCNSLKIQLDEMAQQSFTNSENDSFSTQISAETTLLQAHTPSPRNDRKIKKLNSSPGSYVYASSNNNVDDENEDTSTFPNFNLDKKKGAMDIHKATYYNELNSIDPLEKLKHLELHLKELKTEIDEHFTTFENAGNGNDDGIEGNGVPNIGDQMRNMKLLTTYESIFDSFKQLKDVAEKTLELKDAALGRRSDVSQGITKKGEETIDAAEFSDGARALQIRIKKLKAKLRAKDRNVKFTLDALVVKRDSYKEKVAELLRVSESWRQGKESTVQQTPTKKIIKNVASAAREASGDHVSCDSGVSVVDKTTETLLKDIADASSNTMISGNLSEDELPRMAPTAIKHELQNELTEVKSTIAEREEQLKKYKENLQSMQLDNEELRQNVIDLQEHAVKPNYVALVQIFLPIFVFAVGVFVYILDN